MDCFQFSALRINLLQIFLKQTNKQTKTCFSRQGPLGQSGTFSVDKAGLKTHRDPSTHLLLFPKAGLDYKGMPTTTQPFFGAPMNTTKV